jgi:FeS assembly SUF system regulator
MIKLSRMADYGVVLMVQLARAPGLVTTAAELTEATALPGPTVSKLLKQLSRAGLLDSQRGTNGGYTLSLPTAEISVADIVSALDGPIALTECMTADGVVCEIEALCPTRTNWRQINDALVDALDRVSLAEMARPVFEPRTVLPVPLTADVSV